MTTHLSNEQIESYYERRLSLVDLAHVNTHLFDCELCYDQFLTAFQARRSFPIEIDLNELAGLKSWHLQGDELKSYLEGRLGETDLALANTHLRECAWCREEVYHLSEFTDQLQHYLSKRHLPRKQPSLRQWRIVKSDALYWRLPIMTKAAALILVIIGSAVILWLTVRTNPEEQTAHAPASVQEMGSPTPARSDVSPNLESPTLAQSGHSNENDKSEKELPPGNRGGRPKRSSLPEQNWSDESNSRRASETPLLAGNLEMPRVIEIFDRTLVVLRGNDSQSVSFRVRSPYSTVIGEEQPTFHWTTLTGAEQYSVSIYDAKLNLVEKSEPLTKTQWLVPRHLKRGIIYTWVVTAIKDGKEILAPTLPARAEFKIIEKPALDKLNRSIRYSSSEMARAVLYARAGLLDLAEQELQAYLTLHPTDQAAKKLFQTIKSWREP